MASNINHDLDYILNALELQQYYPEKLTRDDLYQITSEKWSVSDEKSCQSASRQFINNVTRYNYLSRNMQHREPDNAQSKNMGYRERAKQKKAQQLASIHPLDVVAAVFLCCDPIARQDLVMHMWGCKFAIPFFFNMQHQAKPSIFFWPLRSLIGQFNLDIGCVDKPLIDQPMNCIAFLRVGNDNEVSKSALLNHMIGGAEKAHPIFFHRNSEGSKRDRTNVTAGMIEIGWFLPTEPTIERISGPRLFANLRGDSRHSSASRKFIGKLATVSIVLSRVADLEDTLETLTDLIKGGSRVILLLSENEPDDEVIDNFVETNFNTFSDKHFEVIITEGRMLADQLEVLFHNIQKMESLSEKEMSLSEFLKTLSKEDYVVDELCECYIKAFKTSNNIVSTIKDTDQLERKKMLLPLQETFWKDWSKYDRDYWRYDQLESGEKKKYRNQRNLVLLKAKIRKEQYTYFEKNKLSKPIDLFITSLFVMEPCIRKLFLRKLKLDLDKLSRNELCPLERQYETLVNQTIHANEQERSEINEKLTNIDERKTKLSFGLEHIIREIGQLYEACESQPGNNILVTKNLNYTELPKIASFLMMDGYPIEILDGEACSVPLMWLDEVFRTLPSNLQKCGNVSLQNDEMKVHVVSVLGIQSSGKSTFLNTIFGLQFAVSAGRCTRGAFMQAIKVNDSMRDTMDADYILAIDTEGLKAAELIAADSVDHDNELSTFVIGLADTTVINLMGENATYLKDNLPIAVHAFLRMNLAGLHPRCTIVHHNVDKRNKEKLLVQGRLLESVLNNLTRKACDLEKIPHRLFQEIIEFSISENTDYIPALYEGEQPMAPVSLGYSKEAENVKRKILNYCSDDIEKGNQTLSYFSRHLKRLWSAIKRDRFVYEFRTTLEAEARLEIDNQYSSILLGYIDKLDETVDDLISKLSQRTKYETIEATFLKNLNVQEKKCCDDLVKFISKPRRQSENCYKQWKEKYLKRLKDQITHYCHSAVKQLREFRNIPRAIPFYKMEEFLKDFEQKYHTQRESDEEEIFSQAWQQWIGEIVVKTTSVTNDTIKALKEICSSHTYLIQTQTIVQKSLDKFCVMPGKHLNQATSFPPHSGSDLHGIIQTMEFIISSSKDEYKVSVGGIKSKNWPYTDRFPKKVLLRIDKHVSEILSNEDKSNYISFQFRIDLLEHTAGSVIQDFIDMTKPELWLKDLRREMKRAALGRARKMMIKNEDSIYEIFLVMDIKLKRLYQIIGEKSVVSAIMGSVYKSRFISKQQLLGYCLKYILLNSDDRLLETFIFSPKQAVFVYLKRLLTRVMKKELIFSFIDQNVRQFTLKVTNAVGEIRGENVSLEELITVVCKYAEIDSDIEHALRLNSRIRSKENLNVSSFKILLKQKTEIYILEKVDELISFVLDNKDEIVSAVADRQCRMMIGCTAVCPFCKEICKFSAKHIGNHECFVHRPVGCSGMYWKGTSTLCFETCPQHINDNNSFRHGEVYIPFRHFQKVHPTWDISTVADDEPSCIWKWIFVNKYSALRNTLKMELPEKMPGSWKDITQKEAYRSVKESFHVFGHA